MIILRIEQGPPHDGKYPITLRHLVDGVQKRTAIANIEFALSDQEQEELRWYLEDYLQKAAVIAPVVVEQIFDMIRDRGIELYQKVFTANVNTQAVWFAVRDKLADLRIEITTGIAEAASIPWELMSDPGVDSAIALRVKAFVRVQSDPNIAFIDMPPLDDSGRLRLLYIVCRPSGSRDVPLRALANRILQDLGEDRDRFDITALRPPTFEQLQAELGKAKAEGRPYHIVHFDGHGVFADLSKTTLSSWIGTLSSVVLGGEKKGKHGYLLFEHPGSEEKMRPVDGAALGQLLHDHGSPVLVLNACQSAMNEARASPSPDASVHDEIRASGSLSQAVIDQGVPAVLGMRYSVYVVTAAQYIGELYRGLAQGQSFGEAASTGRKHLHLNPDRWLGLRPQTLQDWCVPVVHEAMPIFLLPPGKGGLKLGGDDDRDPVQSSALLRRHVPDGGFIGRDETLLALDRGFDQHRIVLLHAYAGQGKSSTAVEFARWYALTGGLGPRPIVVPSSFDQHLDLATLLNLLVTPFLPMLEAKGIHWHALNEPEKRRKLVLDILRQIPVLWIWDNVEPIAGFPAGTPSQWTAAEQEELRDFLKQIAIDTRSQVKLLLTSRRDEQGWLGHLPHRIKMPRMSAEDAAMLAQQLGKKNQISRSEVADWQPLLDYCAGNPLTLRVLVGQALNLGLRGSAQLQSFTDAIRSGEQAIQDADEKEGRDRSLGACLDYGFKHAFKDDELPIIALLHLFQGSVMNSVLAIMGVHHTYSVPELSFKDKASITVLLERACETALLTRLGSAWYHIHPAVPWFLRQLFAKCYDGQNGRSSSQIVQKAWVNALGLIAEHYHAEIESGRADMVELLELEHENLLAGFRMAVRLEMWGALTSMLQGLRSLYEYQQRRKEWARLVNQVTPYFCSSTDQPIPNREAFYGLVMEYRIKARHDCHDEIDGTTFLAQKLIEHYRVAADMPASSGGEQIPDQAKRGHVRNLVVALCSLAVLQLDLGQSGSTILLEEAKRLCEQIGDTDSLPTIEANLGSAYMKSPNACNLDKAEAAYKRSLNCFPGRNLLARARCLVGIATVNRKRFLDARSNCKSDTVQLEYATESLAQLRHALVLCPKDALLMGAQILHEIGSMWTDLGGLEEARLHYEKAIQRFESCQDKLSSGRSREGMAAAYFNSSLGHVDDKTSRMMLRQAKAYAEAALRDYKCLAGDTANQNRARNMLKTITKESLKLSS